MATQRGEGYPLHEPVPDLEAWYEKEQAKDRIMALRKREEYGSADLRIMAAAMREMLPRPSDEELAQMGEGFDVEEAYYIEAAIAFYVLGKVSRIVGAYGEGRVPGIDSWDDTTIYSMMARRTRQSGGW